MSLDHPVVVAVVLARLLVPLTILRYPLPGMVLSAFVVDAIDRDIYEYFLDVTEREYQRFDKALDTYYAAIAYVAMVRRWSARTPMHAGRFLFFLRLTGVVLFGWTDLRWLLAAFPNAFDFFFVGYELIRRRVAPAAMTPRAWIVIVAGVLAITFAKEFWVHIAMIDTAELLAEHWWFIPVLALLAIAALAAVVRVLHRLPSRTPPQPGEQRGGHRPAAMRGRERVLLVAFSALVFFPGLPAWLAAAATALVAAVAFLDVIPRASRWAPGEGAG